MKNRDNEISPPSLADRAQAEIYFATDTSKPVEPTKTPERCDVCLAEIRFYRVGDEFFDFCDCKDPYWKHVQERVDALIAKNRAGK